MITKVHNKYLKYNAENILIGPHSQRHEDSKSLQLSLYRCSGLRLMRIVIVATLSTVRFITRNAAEHCRHSNERPI